MNFLQVSRQIQDLPSGYLRPDSTFQSLMDSLTDAQATFNEEADGVASQLTFANAQLGWLDVWGLILGIPRNQNEGDAAYMPRISAVLLAWVGTVPAIQAWGLFVFGTPISVTENSGLGYVISFPAGLSSAQIAAFIASLGRIRPIGVPFSAVQQLGSLYTDTIDYVDTYDVVGSYLTAGTIAVSLGLGSVTLSAQSLLADYYFTDPTLNPAG